MLADVRSGAGVGTEVAVHPGVDVTSHRNFAGAGPGWVRVVGVGAVGDWEQPAVMRATQRITFFTIGLLQCAGIA